ncbi:HVO_A0556 family zinc finger protein [Halobellus rubicundus]|uniref:HVO_A0556 family zinc finger protein n=1 Tax=Halobellus rubicundus TaxID=2996466 RepID=A0ABD5MH53_9EURY
MSDQESTRRDPEQLLDRMETADCHYCDGDLDVGEYKDSAAILCEDCGTPAVRVW